MIKILLEWLNSFGDSIFATGWISNAFWNVTVSVLSIVFTVFFIDQKAKQREEIRWRPAKDNVYFKLFCELFRIIDNLSDSPKKTDQIHYYYFGIYFIGLHYDINSLKQRETNISGIHLQGLNNYHEEQINESYKNIDQIIHQSPQLLDPELLSKLLEIKISLELIIQRLNYYMRFDPDDREGSIDLEELFCVLIETLFWLSKKTHHLSKR